MLLNGLPPGLGNTVNTESDSAFVTERVRGFIDAAQVSTAQSEMTFQKMDNDRNVHDFASDDKFIKIPAGAKVNFAVLYPIDADSYTSIQKLDETVCQVSIGLSRALSTPLGAGDIAYKNYNGGVINPIANPAFFVENWFLNKNKTAPLFMLVHTMGPVPRIAETVSGMYVKCKFIKPNTQALPLKLGIHVEYTVMRDDIYSRLYST